MRIHEIVLHRIVGLVLTPGEAAELLGVSLSFCTQLLDSGELPSHRLGLQRYVRLRDAVEYRDRVDARRRQVLDELIAQGQRLGMGYDADTKGHGASAV